MLFNLILNILIFSLTFLPNNFSCSKSVFLCVEVKYVDWCNLISSLQIEKLKRKTKKP